MGLPPSVPFSYLTRCARSHHARPHLPYFPPLSQGIIDFHLQNECEDEEDDSSESDYEGVGEYLERLLKEEVECVKAGDTSGTGVGHSTSSVAPTEGDVSGAFSAGGVERGASHDGSGNLSLLIGTGVSTSGDSSSFPPKAVPLTASLPPPAQSHRRSRTHSLDGGDGTSMEEASLMSKEELLVLLRRVKESNRRLLERSLAAEAEVAALRSQGPNGSLSNCVTALRGEG